MADGKRVWSFVLLNYFYKSWSNLASRDSFGMLRMSRLQNCPWFWKLTKICRSNWAKEKTNLSFHQIFLKANIALYLSSLRQFLVVLGLPYISTSIMWGNGSMCTMIWDIFGFCLHLTLSMINEQIETFLSSIGGEKCSECWFPWITYQTTKENNWSGRNQLNQVNSFENECNWLSYIKHYKPIWLVYNGYLMI